MNIIYAIVYFWAFKNDDGTIDDDQKFFAWFISILLFIAIMIPIYIWGKFLLNFTTF